jgi:two-component system chemotaxis response regulator CheB
LSGLRGSTNKVRVLVVDDSAFVRRAIIRMFDGSPEISIIDVASDGQMAIELIKKHHPDVVTLDVQMPVLDGISALERIMKECPVPVVMLSSLTGRGGDQTLKALELGAVDFIDKSSAGGVMDLSSLQKELSSKILVASRVDLKKLINNFEKGGCSPEKNSPCSQTDSEAVFIGISTGGPPALQAILSAIPASYKVPVFIVQHMPAGFTASLADRLNRTCAITVKEAEDREIALPGRVYIAPGGTHLKVSRENGEIRISLDQSPAETLHRPSVDVLFQSAAESVGEKALAFVLTGMGKDGVAGARAIKEAGGRVYAESDTTAVVFGMPKAVIEAVKVDGVVPLYSVADTMLKMI